MGTAIVPGYIGMRIFAVSTHLLLLYIYKVIKTYKNKIVKIGHENPLILHSRYFSNFHRMIKSF